MQESHPPGETSPNHAKRLAWLLACVLAGLAIAIVGESLSGSPVWFMAVPAAIVVGWLFVANPTECEPQPRIRIKGNSDNETAR